MADDDSKIVIPVEVIGDDEARRKIEALSETVQRVINKQASNAGISPEEFYRRSQATKAAVQASQQPERDRDSKAPPNLEQEAFGETNKEVGRTAEAVRLFREALHALHPAFGEAGISITEMTGLVRASTGGVVALAAAIGGLLVTALEKAGDEANDAASKLSTFATGGTNPREGRREFAGLQETGRGINEFPTSLAGPFEQLLRINQNQPSDKQLASGDLRESLENLVKGLQAERVEPEKGIAALNETLSSIREKGFITGDSLKALENIAPRLTATLLGELNKQRPGSAVFTDREFLGATRAAGGQISLDLRRSEAEFPQSITDAWHRVKVAADRLSEISTGGNAVAGALSKFADFLDLVGEAAKKVQEHSTAANITKGALSTVLPFLNLLPNFTGREGGGQSGTADQQDRLNQSFQRTLPTGTAEAAEHLREAFLRLHPTVEGSQKILEDWSDKQKELTAVSANAAKKQAAINLKFEPEETRLGLQKDEIRVASADIHLEQAKISGLEAQKGKEVAGLSNETAEQALRSAQNRYSDALEKFFENRGVDTSSLHQANQSGRDLDALNEAALGVKRARIERKYSHLDEPKADLAAQQAQTAIRSAELERQDASLKLAKDQYGAPVSHELAQLRYAQAALDFDKVKVELLQKILGALNKYDRQAAEDVRNLPREDGSGRRFGPATQQPREHELQTHEPHEERPHPQQPTPPQEKQAQQQEQVPLPRPRPQEAIDAGTNALIQELQSIGNFLQGIFSKVTGDEGLAPQPATEGGEDAKGLGDAASSLTDSLSSLTDAISGAVDRINSEDAGGGTVTAAGGGYIRGSGTTTSDSIEARLSDKEYVQPADATEHYGVAFMDAIREKRFPRGFAFGGLARLSYSAPSLGFAGGGLARSSATSTPDMQHWGTVDLRTNHGDVRVATESDTMRNLSSRARAAKRFSTGRKPGWYEGAPR